MAENADEFGTGWQRWNLQAWLDYVMIKIMFGRVGDVIPKTYVPILRLVCEDLESTIQLKPGPGTLLRVSGVPVEVLQPLENRCWREVLLDEDLGRLAWIGLRNYAKALKAKDMDPNTQRTGRLLHAVALVRLEALGEVQSDRDRAKRILEERRRLSTRTYIPKTIARVLASAVKRLDRFVYDQIAALITGEFTGGIKIGNIKNEYVELVYGYIVEDQIPGDLINNLDRMKELISDGNVDSLRD